MSTGHSACAGCELHCTYVSMAAYWPAASALCARNSAPVPWGVWHAVARVRVPMAIGRSAFVLLLCLRMRVQQQVCVCMRSCIHLP